MKNRYMPFGYHVVNGIITIDDDESETVKLIFTQYVSGMSLKKIAEMLTLYMKPSSIQKPLKLLRK